MKDFNDKELQELIEMLLHYDPKPPTIVMPRWWLHQEVAEHPERFSVSNDEDKTMTWCGYIVYTFGDRYESN